ncbi:hypothetical protein AB1E19_017976 [Capra hircus]
MGRPVCVLLAGSVWAVSAVSTSVHTGLMTRLTFCGPNQIQHFFCEVPTLLLLSCSPTTLNNVMIVVTDVYFGVVSFLLTMASHGCIIAGILCTRSAAGKQGAFSTCSSHLLVVALYYPTVVYTYILPGSGFSLENSKVVALLYTAVSPTLNPLIYSLQNKDVRVALRKVLTSQTGETPPDSVPSAMAVRLGGLWPKSPTDILEFKVCSWGCYGKEVAEWSHGPQGRRPPGGGELLADHTVLRLLLRTRSRGASGAPSACSSRLPVVALHYPTVICTYIRPASSRSLDKDKLVSVISTSVAPPRTRSSAR